MTAVSDPDIQAAIEHWRQQFDNATEAHDRENARFMLNALVAERTRLNPPNQVSWEGDDAA